MWIGYALFSLTVGLTILGYSVRGLTKGYFGKKEPIFGVGLTIGGVAVFTATMMIVLGVGHALGRYYEIPLVVFLVLSIYASFFSTVSNSSTDDHMARIRLGFSCAIVIVSIIGLTVHFWNSIWIFFSLCIGIRASFVEFEARRRSRPLG